MNLSFVGLTPSQVRKHSAGSKRHLSGTVLKKAGTHTGMRPTKKLPGNGAKITRLAGGNDMFYGSSRDVLFYLYIEKEF
jgi:hypothetical protein